MPSEHIAIIKEPDQFVELRTDKDAFAKGIDTIYGLFRDGTEEVQSLEFDKRIFTSKEAEQWLSAHNFEPLEFEPAEGEGKMIAYQIKACKTPELSAKVDGDSGFIEGYAAIFDIVDLDNDIIKAGAFKRSIDNQIAAGKVLLMSRHFAHGADSGEAIGKIVEAKEDQTGFWIKAKLFESQHAQETRSKVMDAPDAFGMSVGWKNVEGGFKRREGEERGFEFTEMNLREVTLTLNPAQSDTIGSVSAKTAEEAKAHNERFDLLEQRMIDIEKRVYCVEAKSEEDEALDVVTGATSPSARNSRTLTLLED